MTSPQLTIVIPFHNEARTLERCVNRVLETFEKEGRIEILLVDDGSKDDSPNIAKALSQKHPQLIRTFHHPQNRGKGAALHTGFAQAHGDFVAVQDADLEYDPADLIRLLAPLRSGQADVVFGSRFLSFGSRRVMYFWHRQINRTLTVLSNMLTDLDLTDMETCYKVFRRDLLQSLDLRETGFGFEPEVVAKVAAQRVRIYEIGISYHARSYAEGKHIRPRDGLRALYCILRYNLSRAPAALQFIFYLGVGGVAAVANLVLFLILKAVGLGTIPAALTAFIIAAILNYRLSVSLLFRRNARWHMLSEWGWYAALVAAVGIIDSLLTAKLIETGFHSATAKLVATAGGLILNFVGRKYLVFYERGNPDWKSRNLG